MNLALWQARFREYLAVRNYSERARTAYVNELRPFFGQLEESGVQSLSDLTREAVEGYRSYLFRQRYRGKRITASTQCYRLSAVKAFTRYLARERFILMDPAADVELPRMPRTLPRTLLSEKEVERVLEAPDVTRTLGLRDRAILEVLYGTAIRNSELRDLRLCQVDVDRGELRVEQGKGGKSRLLPLSGEALVWLREYIGRARPCLVVPPDPGVVFLTTQGRKMQRGPLARLVRRLGRRAGLPKPVTPHVLRNCCATHMLRRGAGLRHLQELMGHESPETTQRYTRIEVSDLRRVLARCHPRERSS